MSLRLRAHPGPSDPASTTMNRADSSFGCAYRTDDGRTPHDSNPESADGGNHPARGQDRTTPLDGLHRDLTRLVNSSSRARRSRIIEPDDAAQEAWLALFANARSGRSGPDHNGRALAWSAAVVRNRLSNVERDAAKRNATSLSPGVARGLVGREADPAEAHECGWVRESVRASMEEFRGRVPDLSYQVIFLRWMDGRTVPEIAQALGLTALQVRDRHRRAFPLLRSMLWRSLGWAFPSGHGQAAEVAS